MTSTLVAPTLTSPTSLVAFKLAWWNAGDFFHFDAAKTTQQRWPKSSADYQNKCSRVVTALNALSSVFGKPNLLALGEITRKAAHEVRDRLFPGFDVISLDTKPDDPTLQVAIIHEKSTAHTKFSEQPPIIVPATPRGTRPMAVLDVISKGNRIRCIVCHWQARFDDSSDAIRRRIADHLSQYAYDFLSPHVSEKRSIVILGDLNEEPYEAPQGILNAHRHRARSGKPVHWADRDAKRIHLYNCSWRLLGEINPHQLHPSLLSPGGDAAGTYYWEDKQSWHNLDHVIVSNGLLGHAPPFLDESEVAIAALPEFMPDGFPCRFSFEGKAYKGLSDHLPIVATIQLES